MERIYLGAGDSTDYPDDLSIFNNVDASNLISVQLVDKDYGTKIDNNSSICNSSTTFIKYDPNDVDYYFYNISLRNVCADIPPLTTEESDLSDLLNDKCGMDSDIFDKLYNPLTKTFGNKKNSQINCNGLTTEDYYLFSFLNNIYISQFYISNSSINFSGLNNINIEMTDNYYYCDHLYSDSSLLEIDNFTNPDNLSTINLNIFKNLNNFRNLNYNSSSDNLILFDFGNLDKFYSYTSFGDNNNNIVFNLKINNVSKSLKIYDNGLTNINGIDFSNIEDLTISDNKLLNNISTLDLSNNNNSLYIDFNNNNLIDTFGAKFNSDILYTSIDLDQNDNLEDLRFLNNVKVSFLALENKEYTYKLNEDSYICQNESASFIDKSYYCGNNTYPDGMICDDNNQETINDIYTDQVCAGTYVANGSSCDDNNSETIDDKWYNGVCSGYILGESCDDNNPDTINDSIKSGGICIGEKIGDGFIIFITNNKENEKFIKILKDNGVSVSSVGDFTNLKQDILKNNNINTLTNISEENDGVIDSTVIDDNVSDIDDITSFDTLKQYIQSKILLLNN